VVRSFAYRIAAIALGLAFGFTLTGTKASAALDVVVGVRNVVKGEPVSSCDSKASRALVSILGKSAEIGDTHEWEAAGAVDTAGNSFAAAAVHCYPLGDTGYFVTFTCAAQAPPAPETADVICSQLASSFGGGP